MSDHRRKSVMAIANSLIDSPAVLYTTPEKGGSPEEGFDCSGFVTYVLREAGLHVPKFIGMDDNVREIRHANEYWDHYGALVHESKAQSGDLVFFARNGLFPTHLGFLTYHGTIIHSPGLDGTKVEESTIDHYAVEAPRTGTGRQLYDRNPIGYKALTAVLDTPTARYHQRPLA